MPNPTDSMTLSSLRLPTPKTSRSNLNSNITIATSHFGSEIEDDHEDTRSESEHSDTSSFFDIEGVATATTGSESRHDEDDFDIITDTEEETGDEL